MKAPQPLPKHSARWVQAGGLPTPEFFKYMRDLDQVARLLVQENGALVTRIEALEMAVADLETRVNDLENP